MKDFKNILLAVFTFALANLFVSEVSATPVTTSFDTTVQYTSGIAGVNVGDSFSGSFTYDNDPGAVTSAVGPGCTLLGGCPDYSATYYRFLDPAYTANISTPSLSYSSEGVLVNVFWTSQLSLDTF